MYVIWGTRTFHRKRSAYRREHCLNCEVPTYVLLTRCWIFFTFFFIPLIPLRFHSRWLCSVCGNRPEKLDQTRRPFKWAFLVLLGVMLASAFAVTDEDPNFLLGMRIVVGVIMVAVLISIIRHRKPDLEERARIHRYLQELPPEDHCPFCSDPLQMVDGGKACTACDLVLHPDPTE